MKIYNTLTKQKEEFKPLKGNSVRMYSCGPTVYNYAHIGNLRTYLFMDLLRRVLIYNNFKVKGIMNITDVGHLLSDADDGEDKMVTASKRLQKSPYEIADYYTKIFLEDIKKLNIIKPELTPKATEHINEMLDFVYGLCDKGYAYETSDGIYFDIEKFEHYGKLSGLNLDEQLNGARVEVNTEKKHPADFAIWKKAPKEHIMQWDSKWGKGYPGWHIECSAMSKKYLGDEFDIHTGGVDHIPVHHENEIAQSEALTGKNPAKAWMHGEFMLVDGGKMSKKLGNTYTISQLEEMKYTPMHFRYFCLNAHYRKKLNFTFEGMDGAKTAYERLALSVLKHKNSTENIDENILKEYKTKFEESINDDLNISEALGILWNLVKEKPGNNVYSLILEMDKVFGLELNNISIEEEKLDIAEDVLELIEKRKQARLSKDFALSDTLRDAILEKGYLLKDTKDGMEIKKAN